MALRDFFRRFLKSIGWWLADGALQRLGQTDGKDKRAQFAIESTLRSADPIEIPNRVAALFTAASRIEPNKLGNDLNWQADKALKSLDYSKAYYDEHKDAGLDYLGHGYWQTSYALMVTEATLQETYAEPAMLDAGCACGSILTGFKKTARFKSVLGVDLSEHMVSIGRKHFDFTDQEMVAGSIAKIPAADGAFTLVHSAQVLEHIPDDLTDAILSEFARVLRPGGRAFLCLDAIRHGETKEIYMGDPTHCNIKPVMYWTQKLQDRGLYFDVEAYNRFVQSKRGPTEGEPLNFYQHYPFWSAWTLIKG